MRAKEGLFYLFFFKLRYVAYSPSYTVFALCVKLNRRSSFHREAERRVLYTSVLQRFFFLRALCLSFFPIFGDILALLP